MTDTAGASFDGLAEAYAAFRTGYADELFALLGRWNVTSGARVLDVGCGTGLVAAELVARGAIVSGVDLSEPMLARARSAVPQATFVRSAAESLPFADASFDVAVSAQAFHWFDQPRALEECARVVRPGGTVAIWWKELARGDAFRHLRHEVERELGVEPLRPILETPFAHVFDDAPLVAQQLHVIPWSIERSAAELLGYERSRARSRAAFGEAIDGYLARIAARLRAHGDRYVLSYVHHLFLARVPG